MDSFCAPTQLMPKKNQITAFLSEPNLARLQEVMTTRQYKDGEYLFWEEEPVESMYYLIRGQVNVTKSTEEGKNLIIYILQKGDLFGEFGGFNKVKSTFNGEAIKDCEVGIIPIHELERLIATHGSFAVEFIKWMGLLQRTTESKFRDLLMYGKTGALASTLIRLSNSYGKATKDGIEIQMKLTNSDLANMIGTTRESVNRLLATYKDDKVLSFEHGMMTIHDLKYFRTLVSCPDCPEEICRI